MIDVDLEVMRQLLMLNDQVEELKWQRRQCLASSTNISSPAYDLDVDSSPWSHDDRFINRWSCEVSTLDRSPTSRDFAHGRGGHGLSKYPTPSALSLLRTSSQDCCSSMEDIVDCKLDSSVFDTPAVETSKIKLFVNNNNNNNNGECGDEKSKTQASPTDTKRTLVSDNDAAAGVGGDAKTVADTTSGTNSSSGDAGPATKSVAANPTKTKPAIKPKPKSLTAKGGELRVSFTTSVTKRNDTPATVPHAAISSSGNSSGNSSASESSPGVQTTKDDVTRKVRTDKAVDKLEKHGKLKDSSVHSGGPDSLHELSAYVEMLI